MIKVHIIHIKQYAILERKVLVLSITQLHKAIIWLGILCKTHMDQFFSASYGAWQPWSCYMRAAWILLKSFCSTDKNNNIQVLNDMKIEYIITEMEFFDVNDDIWTLTKQNVYLSALTASTSVFVRICVCAEVVTVLIWI